MSVGSHSRTRARAAQRSAAQCGSGRARLQHEELNERAAIVLDERILRGVEVHRAVRRQPHAAHRDLCTARQVGPRARAPAPTHNRGSALQRGA